ncbi:MAG TPA: CPBP family intramembrane glutamic endopeptidase [Polyangia bacterium]|nr:CPBP family intramembrane glutamic endopeptidase [Polyangia bacterium]
MKQLPPTPQPPRLGRAQLVLGLYAALALAGVLTGGYRGDANVYTLPGAKTGPLKLALSPLCGVALGLFVVFLSRLAVHRFEWARLLHREFRALLGELGQAEILLLALASSVGEEVFFRGALLPAIGIWASSAVFALLHIGPGRRYLPWTVSAFLMGLAMSVLARWLGDLGAPIAAHFTINFMNLRHITSHELL